MTDNIDKDLSILAKILLHAGIATLEELIAASTKNKNNGKGLLFNLVSLGYISDENLLEKLGSYLALPVFDFDDFQQSSELIDDIGRAYVTDKHIIPVKKTDDTLTVLLDDPTNIEALNQLRFETGLTIKLYLASPASIVSEINILRLRIKLENNKNNSIMMASLSDDNTEELMEQDDHETLDDESVDSMDMSDETADVEDDWTDVFSHRSESPDETAEHDSSSPDTTLDDINDEEEDTASVSEIDASKFDELLGGEKKSDDATPAFDNIRYSINLNKINSDTEDVSLASDLTEESETDNTGVQAPSSEPAHQKMLSTRTSHSDDSEVLADGDEDSADFDSTMIVSPDDNSIKTNANEEYISFAVYYATDRAFDDNLETSDTYFIGKRNDSNALSYGRCSVSIPNDHRVGHVERPSWLRMQFSENPEKHMTVLDFAVLLHDEFFTDINTFLSDSGDDSALVFVHGYNVSFQDAILRTAQIAYDLNFTGPAVSYSWPSTGTVKGYLTDANNARWSEPHFKDFLNDIRASTGVKNIHIIAHSMGSRVLAGALSGVADDFSSEQVIFAAPDIDADVFKELTGTFHQKVKRITLYASSNDEALSLSRKLQGDYARAGETISGVLVYPNVDSIDATQVNTGLLGHSYYGDNRSIVSDIYHLIRQDMPPNKRFGMNEKENEQGNKYWEFRP